MSVLSRASQATRDRPSLISKRVRAKGQRARGQGVRHLRHALDSSGAELRHRLQHGEGGRGGGRGEEGSRFIPVDEKGVHRKSFKMLRGVPEESGQRKNEAVPLQEPFGFAPGSVFVVRVFLHVLSAQPLGLVDIRTLLGVREQLPLRAKPLADLRVVHLWVFLGHFPPLASGPNHERIHGSLDVI